MSFTVKYRTFESIPTPPDCTSAGFVQCERLDGPYESISARYEDGFMVVYCCRNDLSPGMTYGPVIEAAEQPTPEQIAEFEKQASLYGQGERDTPPDPLPGMTTSRVPRPTLWVMNEAGATIAKYDL